MVSYAKLKAATGNLTQADVQAMDALFISREESKPEKPQRPAAPVGKDEKAT